MRLMGIQALYPKKHLSAPGLAVFITLYRREGLKIDRGIRSGVLISYV